MQKGLVISNISNLYKVKVENEVYEAVARGKLKKDEISPVVGDRVEIEILEKEKKQAVIQNILERKNYIKRPKMSNITQLIFVISSKMPKPDLLMLDKQLAFAEYLGIKPVIVLNKIDLEKKEKIEEIQKVYQDIGYLVIQTNAKEKIGIEDLKEILKCNISAFSGNSGVGKSTLINCLFQRETTKEGEISNKNKKGKNTTTQVHLYELEENTYIADTPGFSTFDIYEIESKELEKYFIEFKPYIKECEFVGCTHQKEENCGIKKAMKEGKIAKGRYDRFVQIYQGLKEKEERRW